MEVSLFCSLVFFDFTIKHQLTRKTKISRSWNTVICICVFCFRIIQNRILLVVVILVILFVIIMAIYLTVTKKSWWNFHAFPESLQYGRKWQMFIYSWCWPCQKERLWWKKEYLLYNPPVRISRIKDICVEILFQLFKTLGFFVDNHPMYVCNKAVEGWSI